MSKYDMAFQFPSYQHKWCKNNINNNSSIAHSSTAVEKNSEDSLLALPTDKEVRTNVR